MKILFLSYICWPPDFGGELLLSIERLETLVTRGHQAVILTSGRPGFASIDNRAGVTILRSPRVGRSRLSRLFRRVLFWIWALFKLSTMEYDVLHWLGMPGIGIRTTSLAALSFSWLAHFRSKHVVTVHALADSQKHPLQFSGHKKFWKQVALKYVDYIVAVSPALYTPLKDAFPDKATIILNGIRDDLFINAKADRTKVRRKNLIDEDEVIFTFLGTVGRRKGFDILAKAFINLSFEHPHYRLWIIGPYSPAENQNINHQEVKELLELIAPLKDRVKLWGRVDTRNELAQLLASSDVFVFPTRREGLPLAPLEAMAAGIPVVITRIPGVTDLANIEGKTGLYIQINSVEDLEVAMLKMGEDKTLRQKMGKMAQQVILDRFSWEQHISKWENLYAHNDPWQ